MEKPYRYLFGRSSGMAAYDTNANPHENPSSVDPAISVGRFCATAAVIWMPYSVSRCPFCKSLRRVITAPIREMNSPVSITFRRPKMSLRDPAREKETEDAIDHPDTTQPRFAKSPKAVPMGKRIDVVTIKPQETGATIDDPTN